MPTILKRYSKSSLDLSACIIFDSKIEPTIDATLKGHSGLVRTLAMLPDGGLCSASWDDTIKIWDIKNQACLATLNGQDGGVWSPLAMLPDGRLVSGSTDTTIKIWDLGLRSLTLSDVTSLLGSLFTNRSVTYVNLQQVLLDEKAILLLSSIIAAHPTLKHLDLRQTGLSAEAVGPLYTAARQRADVKIQHESMPYYQLDFARYAQKLREKPEDKEAHQHLMKVSQTAHLAVLKQFNFILEHPEVLTVKALQEMFGNVCHVVDIKFPYTLLNMGIKANSFTSAQKEHLKAAFFESLSHLAKLAVVGTECAVNFKLVLESALRKKLITHRQYLELNREAEKCDTFADNRFKELRQQLLDVQAQLQAQINDIRAEVGDVKREVSEVKREVGVLKDNVQRIATDLNQLKTALKKKAQRDVYFGIAKTALSFIGGGIVDFLQSGCDLSDFEELSCTIFNVNADTKEFFEKRAEEIRDFFGENRDKVLNNMDADTKEFLEKKAEQLREFFEEHREVILDKFGEKGAKKLGYDPEELIENWSETSLLLQQLPLSTAAEDKKTEESSYGSAKPKTESKTPQKPQSTQLPVAVPVIKATPEVQKFKEILAKLIKHEDGGFTFQLKRLRFDCLQLQFTAANSILMSAEDIKKELIVLAKSFKEAVASLGIKPTEYKADLNWKEWSFTIMADTTGLTSIGGLLHQAGAAFFQSAPQAKAVLFTPVAGKSQASTKVESKDAQPAVTCILQ